MTILFIIVAVAFTVAMTILMVRPFSSSRDEQLSFELLDEEERKIEALVSRKVALVQALEDIEYDFKTNKISREDYERFKKSCERQAVGVMRKLEQLHGGDGFEEIIDREVRRRLEADATDPAESTSGDDATASSPDSDEPPPEPPADRCPSCGTELDPDDRFCSQCGTSVAEDGPDGHGLGGDELSSSPSSEVAP